MPQDIRDQISQQLIEAISNGLHRLGVQHRLRHRQATFGPHFNLVGQRFRPANTLLSSRLLVNRSSWTESYSLKTVLLEFESTRGIADTSRIFRPVAALRSTEHRSGKQRIFFGNPRSCGWSSVPHPCLVRWN